MKRSQEVTDPETLLTAHNPDTVTWVDVQGIGDEQLIRRIGEIFSLHPLAIEDVVNVPQRPKADPYDEHMLIIVRMVKLNGPQEIDMEQVSIVLGKHYVLTFLAGIYGMNFEHMPELHVKWAYPLIWIAMLAVAAGMLAFFWRKGWIGSNRSTIERDEKER